MDIGVPKEIKNHEYRVALPPAGVQQLIKAGHKVRVETRAADHLGFSDQDYRNAGAQICNSAVEVWDQSTLILKVKEPQPGECDYLRADHILFTYLHLAADEPLTERLLASGCTAIAYETVTGRQGDLPLLTPMSEVAGRMSVQAGAHCLEISQQGRGVLLSGVPGVEAGRVVILGGGVVGSNAAKVALGMGADVTILDTSATRLAWLEQNFSGKLTTLYSTADSIEQTVLCADLVIGAVLIPGAAAPKLVSEELVSRMKQGAVLVDVAIDQGGCFATSSATTHSNPTFIKHGVVHYCVANMPGAVARTSSQALSNVTLPYVLQLANHGWRSAFAKDPGFANGLNVHQGQIYCPGVASAFNRTLATLPA
ncbi:alanine dehydrogenase [Neptuniibacter sp. CAU 1671]|uniref:alanine dehydrogenase n=1 Tax=Neptuniibacter sp. CAU 1671 TaxID=3032593 RepID=UPI0023DA6FDE|nr:alanine dehydrogenase [Neptuniibacter sp. CAU 1671]MDF2182413.1 alanine dehydrogenase [Neptuniibacter sp. CAU 1671]